MNQSPAQISNRIFLVDLLDRIDESLDTVRERCMNMKRQAGLRNFAENPAQLHPVFRLCIRLEVEHVVVHRLIDLFSINGRVEVLITLKELQLRDSWQD